MIGLWHTLGDLFQYFVVAVTAVGLVIAIFGGIIGGFKD